MTRRPDSSGGLLNRAVRPWAGIGKVRRRASGPLDTSTFSPPLLPWAPSPHSSELARLSLYRLGLSGTHGKYRVVPRSAIFAHERLAAAVHADTGEGLLRRVIERLWRDYGAPSRRVIDEFLAEADRHDRSAHIGRAEDLAAERRRILQEWLRACRPPSAASRLRQNVELAVCFAMRRSRQYTRALRFKLSG